MTIKEITLLSMEECQRYTSIIPAISDIWWLRTPGYFVFDADNDIFCGKDSIYTLAVRPALRLNLEPSESLFWYKPERLVGTKIRHGNYNWTVLDTNFGEIYAICDDPIGYKRIDSATSVWEKSEFKHWLETEGLLLITS